MDKYSVSSVVRRDRRGINHPQLLRDYLRWGENPYKYGASLSSLPAFLPMARSVETHQH